MATAYKDAFNDAEPLSTWGIPDLSITRQGVAPPRFPLDLLGPFRSTVEALASASGAPVDFTAMSMLSLAASVIGSKRKLRPHTHADWAEAAILWVGLVCPPSLGKTPAIRPFNAILNRLQAEYLDEHKDTRRVWQSEVERAKAEEKAWQEQVAKAVKDGLLTPELPTTAVAPSEPIARRFCVNDTTPEALSRILSGNEQGVVVIADELSSFFGSFDRYNNASEGFWLGCYNGDPFTIDRKGSPEPVHLPFLGASVLGGIQPSRLAPSFKNANTGLLARFLWVWPDAPEYSLPTAVPDVGRIEAAFRNLDALQWGTDDRGNKAPVTLTLDERGSAVFEAFDRAVKGELRDCPDTLLMSAVGKFPGQAARLALVVELLNWSARSGAEPRQVTGETMEKVCAFLHDYIRPMAERTYGDAALPDSEQRTVRMARWIAKTKPRQFNASRDILKHRATFGFHNMSDLGESLEALVGAGWIKSIGTRAGSTKGRHSSDYAVNPAILGT